MICSDPSCKVLVDLVKVQRPGQPAPEGWYIGTSGITPTSFQLDRGMAAGLGNGNLHENNSWLSSDLATKEGMHVHEVLWQTTSGTLLPAECDQSTRLLLLDAVQFANDTQRTSASTNSAWSLMNIGHYRITGVLPALRGPEDLSSGECVSVIWLGQTTPGCSTMAGGSPILSVQQHTQPPSSMCAARLTRRFLLWTACSHRPTSCAMASSTSLVLSVKRRMEVQRTKLSAMERMLS